MTYKGKYSSPNFTRTKLKAKFWEMSQPNPFSLEKADDILCKHFS